MLSYRHEGVKTHTFSYSREGCCTESGSTCRGPTHVHVDNGLSHGFSAPEAHLCGQIECRQQMTSQHVWPLPFVNGEKGPGGRRKPDLLLTLP